MFGKLKFEHKIHRSRWSSARLPINLIGHGREAGVLEFESMCLLRLNQVQGTTVIDDMPWETRVPLAMNRSEYGLASHRPASADPSDAPDGSSQMGTKSKLSARLYNFVTQPEL